MLKCFSGVLLLSVFYSQVSMAHIVKFNSLGQSHKGQLIALEEYGHLPKSNLPFVKIEILNVWKNKKLSKIYLIGDKKKNLQMLREEAREKSKDLFQKYSLRKTSSYNF